MQPISAVLITLNEERNIEEALQSLSWADEIVVVDCGSNDDTLTICRKYTDRVLHRDWTGYVDQKNCAVENARHDWIFSLDADERPSPDLILEIQALARKGFPKSGYKIPRITFFLGRWIKHGEWYPDCQLRLFDRRRGKWEGGRVHESIKLDEKPGFLKGEIHHYTYRSLSDYLRRLDIYSKLAASDYQQQGKKSGPIQLFGNPLVAFIRSYLIKGGFLDGTPGLAVAMMAAVSVFFKYAKLYELQRKLP